MKNRLQIRYCEKIFNSKEEIKNHLFNLFNKETSPLKPALAAEPLVLYYKESGETDVNAVLAIGRPTSDDEYFLIDIAGVVKEISELKETAGELLDLPDRLDQEIADRISGDTRLENMIDLLAALCVESNASGRVEAEFFEVLNFSLRSVVDNEVRLERFEFFLGGLDEHIFDEVSLPSYFENVSNA